MHPAQKLTNIAKEYRHLRAEHEREGLEGSWRRRQQQKLSELERRFESLLEHWVVDADQRTSLLNHLHHGAPLPPLPQSRVVLFKGRSAQGNRLEIEVDQHGERFVVIDGSASDHYADERPIDVPFHFANSTYDEVFELDADAGAALRQYLAGGLLQPPWSFAPALLVEGLINADFGLTDRGRRFLHSTATP